jgi:hypothetical protein
VTPFLLLFSFKYVPLLLIVFAVWNKLFILVAHINVGKDACEVI